MIESPRRALPGRAPLRGFSHIDRYVDRRDGTISAKVLPGEYYVTNADEAIVTVLGSCVAACVRDPVCGVGGMNHFLLPAPYGTVKVRENSEATRYGAYAMECLINEILKHGGQRERLEVKVFGGGKILAMMTDIGAQNIRFVREYLQDEGFAVVAEDLGMNFPRKVYYFPHTGRVRLKKLKALHNNTIQERERVYLAGLEEKPVAGDVELF